MNTSPNQNTDQSNQSNQSNQSFDDKEKESYRGIMHLDETFVTMNNIGYFPFIMGTLTGASIFFAYKMYTNSFKNPMAIISQNKLKLFFAGAFGFMFLSSIFIPKKVRRHHHDFEVVGNPNDKIDIKEIKPHHH